MENINEETLQKLKKTIPFKWRVQSSFPKISPTHVQMIAYVDARDVQEHLDSIIGVGNWCDKYEDVKGNLYCSIGIKLNGQWVFKSDCGTESKTEKEKGESSDAFKRAAVKWGVNRDAYRVGMVKLPCKQYGSNYFPCDRDGNFLKGKDLFAVCNKMAKIEDLENFNIDLDHDSNDDLYTLQQLFEVKKDNLNSNTIEHAERIINNKEIKSYKKLNEILQAS